MRKQVTRFIINRISPAQEVKGRRKKKQEQGKGDGEGGKENKGKREEKRKRVKEEQDLSCISILTRVTFTLAIFLLKHL